MNAIGFKNFRKFENFEPLTLGKVNFLVGGNNAGKSTFVKAALLINHFIHSKVNDFTKESIFGTPVMDFDVVDPYDVHIGTFYRAKRLGSDISDPIEFLFDLDDFHFEVRVVGSVVDKKLDPVPVSGEVTYVLIHDKNSKIKYCVDYSTSRMQIEFLKSVDEAVNDMAELNKQRMLLEERLRTETDFVEIINIKNKLRQLNQLVHSQSDVQSEDVLLDLQRSDFSAGFGGNYLVSLIRNFLEYAELPTSAALNKNSKEFKNDVAEKNLLKSKSKVIKDSYTNLSVMINHADLEYIYAHAARQVVFFNSQDKNDYMAQTIHKFMSSKANHNSKSLAFIDYWMSEEGFNIGDGFSIIVHGGEAYEVMIQHGDQETPLADMGMGSIQMMILLLRLATFIKQYDGYVYPPTIIIEEPEQNLHPALQGALADLFAKLSEDYGFTFIVETHSEYLIRKTQVLVKKLKLTEEEMAEKNPFKVYFFPPTASQQPYQMIYRPDGNFQNEFGTGFFDASNELLFEIL